MVEPVSANKTPNQRPIASEEEAWGKRTKLQYVIILVCDFQVTIRQEKVCIQQNDCWYNELHAQINIKRDDREL